MNFIIVKIISYTILFIYITILNNDNNNKKKIKTKITK